MAYYQDPDELEQMQGGQAAQQGAATPQTTSAQSSVISGGGLAGSTQTNTAAAGTPDRGSDKFVGINKYLDANKNQSMKLGDKVAGEVGGAVRGAQQDVSALGSQFQEKAKAGTIANLDTAKDDAGRIVGQASALGAAQKVAQPDADRFKAIRDATYTGPKTLTETEIYNPTAQKVTRATELANLSKDQKGQEGLLKEINKGPNYTTGERKLDSYLLQDKRNIGKLAEARTGYDQLKGSLDKAVLDSSAFASDLGKRTSDASAFARGQVGSKKSEITGSIQKALDELAGKSAAQNQAITSDITDYELDQATLEALGLTEGLNTYGADLNQFFQQADLNSITREGVASPEEYARVLALQDLAGTPDEFLSAAGMGKAGGAKGISFDRSGFESAREAQKAKVANPAENLGVNWNDAAASAGFVSPDGRPDRAHRAARDLADSVGFPSNFAAGVGFGDLPGYEKAALDLKNIDKIAPAERPVLPPAPSLQTDPMGYLQWSQQAKEIKKQQGLYDLARNPAEKDKLMNFYNNLVKDGYTKVYGRDTRLTRKA